MIRALGYYGCLRVSYWLIVRGPGFNPRNGPFLTFCLLELVSFSFYPVVYQGRREVNLTIRVAVSCRASQGWLVATAVVA